MDEVLGMVLTWSFFPTADFGYLFIQFLLFRFFDISKLWPAIYFDKQIKHGAGTILDDVVAGLYSGATFLLIIFLWEKYNFS